MLLPIRKIAVESMRVGLVPGGWRAVGACTTCRSSFPCGRQAHGSVALQALDSCPPAGGVATLESKTSPEQPRAQAGHHHGHPICAPPWTGDSQWLWVARMHALSPKRPCEP